MKYKLITIVTLVCMVILFIVQNNALVNIYFFSWTMSASGTLLFLIIFTLGGISGWIMKSYSDSKPSLKV
ncbi:MAG: hypothetical protein ACD_79C00025G0006 [uncultured bacterium]|nr:MAG: hypothetical protein ACD_79C00025G0006 [uncultured bacterium]